MTKNNTLFYHNWLDVFDDFSLEEVGELTVAILEYDMSGTVPDFSDRALQVAFKSIKGQIDANNEAYRQRCETNRKASKARWNANASERMQTHANASECMPMHTDASLCIDVHAQNADRVSVTDKSVIDKSDSLCVTNNTREEVKAYFEEKKFTSDPDRFIDYNVGRDNAAIFDNPKRWKAVARLWEDNEKSRHPPDSELDLNAWGEGKL